MILLKQIKLYGCSLKTTILYLFSIVICLSCSQLNTDSREHFNDASPFRHGSMGDLADIEYVAGKPEPVSEESLQRGKSLYTNYCLSCHGPSGEGDGVQTTNSKQTPKNLAMLSKKIRNLKLFMVKSKDEGKMPGWKPFFTNRNIVDLEHYISSFNSKK